MDAYWEHYSSWYSITKIETVIEYYIQQNQGEFPANEEDLLRQHYLKKVKASDGYEYFWTGDPIKPHPDAYWNEFSRQFNQFQFAYGTKLEDIVADNGKLYNKTTGNQILLISGPESRFDLNDDYERASFRWYEKMLEIKNKESQKTNKITAE